LSIKQNLPVGLHHHCDRIEHIELQVLLRDCGYRIDHRGEEESQLEQDLPHLVQVPIVNIKRGQGQAHPVYHNKVHGSNKGKEQQIKGEIDSEDYQQGEEHQEFEQGADEAG